jgi:pSer/pThr/pTyr-binding forkhead associated (FHA) protein/ferredoxin
MRDGVFVIEVIQQKLAGKKPVERKADHDETPSAAVTTPARTTKPADETIMVLTRPTESPGPPAESVLAIRSASAAVAYLVRILSGGVTENEYPIFENSVTTIGRKECHILFPNDTMLSDRHASISKNTDGYYLRDDGSATGTFLRVPEAGKIEVAPEDLVRVGRQFLLFSKSDGTFLMTHFDDKGTEKGQYGLSEKTIVLGRQAPDITLDPHDLTMSRRHLAVSILNGAIIVKDLKSANGTYFRVRNAIKIGHGSQLRVGQQNFEFSLKKDAVIHTGARTPAVEQPLPMVAGRTSPVGVTMPDRVPISAAAVLPTSGPSVTFHGTGKTCLVKEGVTICKVAEENGIDFKAECHAGICGSDPIRILRGQENLAAPPGADEKGTLEDICSLAPGEYRLACMTKVKGPVEVEIVKGN